MVELMVCFCIPLLCANQPAADACSAISNGVALKEKHVLVTRGGCSFGAKAANLAALKARSMILIDTGLGECCGIDSQMYTIPLLSNHLSMAYASCRRVFAAADAALA